MNFPLESVPYVGIKQTWVCPCSSDKEISKQQHRVVLGPPRQFPPFIDDDYGDGRQPMLRGTGDHRARWIFQARLKLAKPHVEICSVAFDQVPVVQQRKVPLKKPHWIPLNQIYRVLKHCASRVAEWLRSIDVWCGECCTVAVTDASLVCSSFLSFFEIVFSDDFFNWKYTHTRLCAA